MFRSSGVFDVGEMKSLLSGHPSSRQRLQQTRPDKLFFDGDFLFSSLSIFGDCLCSTPVLPGVAKIGMLGAGFAESERQQDGFSGDYHNKARSYMRSLIPRYHHLTESVTVLLGVVGPCYQSECQPLSSAYDVVAIAAIPRRPQ